MWKFLIYRYLELSFSFLLKSKPSREYFNDKLVKLQYQYYTHSQIACKMLNRQINVKQERTKSHHIFADVQRLFFKKTDLSKGLREDKCSITCSKMHQIHKIRYKQYNTTSDLLHGIQSYLFQHRNFASECLQLVLAWWDGIQFGNHVQETSPGLKFT